MSQSAFGGSAVDETKRYGGSSATTSLATHGLPATHDDNTLDFAWVCDRGAPAYRVVPHLPVNVATHRAGLRALSDHVPIGFLVDMPKITVL